MFTVTGITGKVGGQVARSLLAKGHKVRAVVRTPAKGEEWAALGCEIAVANIDDAAALTEAFLRCGRRVSHDTAQLRSRDRLSRIRIKMRLPFVRPSKKASRKRSSSYQPLAHKPLS